MLFVFHVAACTSRPRPREGKILIGVVIVLHGETDLLEIVPALHTTRGFTRGLDGRQKQRYQDADDGDYHQQFHQGECVPSLEA